MEETRYAGAHSVTQLIIKGNFSVQGPQAVDDKGGVPTVVDQVFKSNPKIEQIAINGMNSGSVYTRLDGEMYKRDDEPKPPPAVEKFLKLVELSGFKILESFHLVNQYSRERDDPWLMVITDLGYFIMGWRKRVISIEWEGMPAVRGILTEDDVTKGEDHVHAYGMEKAMTYLGELFKLYAKAKAASKQQRG